MLSLTRQQQQIRTWYSNDTCKSGADVAREAFETAVQSFDQSHEWIKNKTSMNEALNVVDHARLKYTQTTGKEGKAYECINAVAERVTYYGQVLDVLVQHHPEYVALAWGAFKFVFIGVLNHAELVTELSQALSDIGDRLRTVKLHIDLYPTDLIQEAASRLYAHVLDFLLLAAKWFNNKNPFKRAMSSVVNPFQLQYKPILDKIQRSFEAVERIANGASKAETRDITIAVELLGQYFCEMRKELRGNFSDMSNRVTDIHEIASRTLRGVDAQGIRLSRMEHADIVNLMCPHRQPEDVLLTCKSIARRRGLWSQPSTDFATFIQVFNQWVASTGPTLFTVRAGPRAEARTKDLAVEVAALLKDSSHPILWYLSERAEQYRQGSLDLSDVLKNLIYQLLRQDTELSRTEPDILNVTKFHSPHSDSEWLDLLLLLLRRVETCYIVIETEALYDLAGKDRGWSQHLLQIFDRVIENAKSASRMVKVLLVTYADSPVQPQRTIAQASTTAARDPVLKFTAHIQAPKAVPLSKKRRLLATSSTRRNGLARQLSKVKLVNAT